MRVGLWLLCGVVIWALAAGFTAMGVRDRALALEERLEVLRELDDPLDADLDVLAADVAAARLEAEGLESDLDALTLRPLGVLPVVGRQISSARALSRATSSILGSAERAVVAASDDALADPATRSAGLRTLSDALVALEVDLDGVDLGPTDGLTPQLADARNEFAEVIAEIRPDVRTASRATTGLSSFLDDSDYLVLALNNAEMQAGGGMPLSLGRITVTDGDIDFGAFTPAEDLFPVDGPDVLDADVAANWGFTSPANDYRKLLLTPRFASHGGPQAVAMWNATHPDEPVGGVVAMDSFVVEALLGVVGPVELGDRVFDQSNVLDYLLVGQYEEFALRIAADQRQAVNGLLALEIGTALRERDWDYLELLRALRPMAEGRHVIVYSEDGDEQAAWEAIGVAGRADGDELGVHLLNLGASKLDPYVAMTVDIEPGVGATELVIRIRNDATNELPQYVLGSWEAIGLEPGTYLGRLAVTLPATSTSLGFDPERALEVFGVDGPTLQVVTRVEIDAGDELIVRLPFEHSTDLAVELMPSARPIPTVWTVDGGVAEKSLVLP